MGIAPSLQSGPQYASHRQSSFLSQQGLHTCVWRCARMRACVCVEVRVCGAGGRGGEGTMPSPVKKRSTHLGFGQGQRTLSSFRARVWFGFRIWVSVGVIARVGLLANVTYCVFCCSTTYPCQPVGQLSCLQSDALAHVKRSDGHFPGKKKTYKSIYTILLHASY